MLNLGHRINRCKKQTKKQQQQQQKHQHANKTNPECIKKKKL